MDNVEKSVEMREYYYHHHRRRRSRRNDRPTCNPASGKHFLLRRATFDNLLLSTVLPLHAMKACQV